MDGTTVSVIGAGRLGTALAKTLHEKGVVVQSIYNRSGDAGNLGKKLQARYVGTFPGQTDQLGSVTFITVADDAIAGTAQRLSELQGAWEQKTVMHCSGSASADVLKPLLEKGAVTAAFHPIQTFSNIADPTTFEDIFISLQGDKAAVETAAKLAKLLKAHPVAINAAEKSYLHAAAVFASNYLITLIDLAARTAGAGGMDPSTARKALIPLMKTTLNNAAQADHLEAVLSGPLTRGDVGTVEKHLELLQGDSELHQLYRVLGKHTLDLARRQSAFDAETEEKLEKLLSGDE